jgi:lipopolysaccharide transport system ATP-binding protein
MTTPLTAEIVISAKHLTKIFRIYDYPFNRVRQKFIVGKKKYYREFTALEDVSFNVTKGETVGIVGRNGSGKSTLLQLLCHILKPTSGEVSSKGRVSALLELGAGFHPEFTGKENVYMLSTIMGISKSEIDKCYEEIVNFADIGEHIDLPVKTYSSGMFVRLAFATSIHVDPEILIVDEALAVGDAEFSKKCMQYFHSIVGKKTLIIVSHDINSLLQWCNRIIWLDKGKLRADGSAEEVSKMYLTDLI